MPKFSVGDVCYSHIKRIFQHAIPDGFDTEEWNSTVVKGVVVPGGTKKKVLVRWDIKGTPVEREHGAGFLRKTPEECKVAVKPTKLMMDATQGRKIGEKHLEAGMNVNCIARNVFGKLDVKEWNLGEFTWEHMSVWGVLLSRESDSTAWKVEFDLPGIGKRTRIVKSGLINPQWVSPESKSASIAVETRTRTGTTSTNSQIISSQEVSPFPNVSLNDGNLEIESIGCSTDDDEYDSVDDDVDLESDDDNFDVHLSNVAGKIDENDEEEKVKDDGLSNHDAFLGLPWAKDPCQGDTRPVVRANRLRLHFPKSSPIYPGKSTIQEDATPLEILVLFFPSGFMDAFNASLDAQNIERSSQCEFLCYLLVRLVSSEFARDQNMLWSEIPREQSCYGDLFSHPIVSQILSRRRYYELSKGLDGIGDERDIFQDSVDFLNSITETFFRHVYNMPDRIVVDESMVPMRGVLKSSKKTMESGVLGPNMKPLGQSIARKPKGVGYEVKTAAVFTDNEDGKLPIIFGFLLKSAMHLYNGYESYSPAIREVLILTRHDAIIRTKGTVVVDAGFGSVSCAMSLMEKHGLYLIGSVKGHAKMFPKEELAKDLVDKPIGAHSFRALTRNGTPYVAIGWKCKNDINAYYICTGGTTMDGTPCRKYCWSSTERALISFEVPRPRIVHEYHTLYNAVDIGNKIRQAGFKLETSIRSWRGRIKMWGLGVVLSNAYAVYCMVRRGKPFRKSRTAFVDILLKEILDYKGRMSGQTSSPVGALRTKRVRHMCKLKALRLHPEYEKLGKREVQLACARCRKKTAFFCAQCGADRGKIVPKCKKCAEQGCGE